MEWLPLCNEKDLESLISRSFQKTCLILKFSSRCASSSIVLDRMERSWKEEEMSDVDAYFLDLIRYRDVSDLVGMKFGVHHESPQVLLIRNGKSIYNASHFWISYDDLKQEIVASQIKSEN